MNDYGPTLNDFFKSKGKASIYAKRISKRPEMRELKHNLATSMKGAKVPRNFWARDLAGRISENIESILDIPITTILLAAWSRHAEISKYRDTVKYKPSMIYQVSLFDHEISSEHHPSIDAYLGKNVTIGTLRFHIILSFLLKGVILTIQDGKIMRVNLGSCAGEGSLECSGLRLVRMNSRALTLPGSLDLGSGIEI